MTYLQVRRRRLAFSRLLGGTGLCLSLLVLRDALASFFRLAGFEVGI